MPFPFLCLLFAFILIYIPRLVVAKAQIDMPEGLDNKTPRDQQTRLSPLGKRANGAHNNSFEAFAPFAAAVFVAHLGQANPQTSSILAGAFVAARVVYLGLYLGDLDKLRTMVWLTGFGLTIALFVLPYFR